MTSFFPGYSSPKAICRTDHGRTRRNAQRGRACPQIDPFIDPGEIDPIYFLRTDVLTLFSQGEGISGILCLFVEAMVVRSQRSRTGVFSSGNTLVWPRPSGALLNMMMFEFTCRDRETGNLEGRQPHVTVKMGGTGGKPDQRLEVHLKFDLPD